MYKYHCVFCGQEIQEEEMLVPLAYMALDGAKDNVKLKNHLYVTKKRLRDFVTRVDRKLGSQYLDMKELLEIAYSKINRGELVNAASSAAEAYEVYSETYENAMAELREARENKGDGLSDLNGEEFDEELAREDAWEKVKIPGFNPDQVRQLCENFEDGRCVSRMSLAKGFGLEFRLDRQGKHKSNTPSYVCPHCRMEICDCAFETKQIMVGFVGFQDVGKSCLIMALSNYLIDQGGALKIPNFEKYRLYTQQYEYYRAGLTLKKTESEMGDRDLYSPSVLYEDILWTFVDVPGDVIFNNMKAIGFKPELIIENQKFQAILHCDTYILCSRKEDIDDPLQRTKTTDVFRAFLRYASEARNEDSEYRDEEETHIRFPVILTLTQIDESAAVKGVTGEDNVLYNMNEYMYGGEYSVMMANGMGKFIESLKSLCYFTPISTSAYGFAPVKFQDWQKEGKMDARDLPTEIHARPQPRNLKMLFHWVQMINRIKPALHREEASDKKMYLADINREEAHFDDDTVTAISQLFCNPSDTDMEWYNTMGGGVFFALKRNRIKSKAKKLGALSRR